MSEPGGDREHVVGADTDPVLVRRQLIARWSAQGKRFGYSLYAVAIVMFFVAFATSWSGWIVTVIVACMAVGAVALIPAIIFAYGVKAADREDRGEPFSY